MNCPACGQRASDPLFTAPSVPVLCNILCPTPQEARAVPRGRVDLAACPACGLVFNAAFEPQRVQYRGEYENALHYSPRFRRYAEDLATELATRHPLAGKAIVEVGCGDGFFLTLLTAAAGGGASGLGFDPAYDAARAGDSAGNIRITAGIYGPGAAKPDMLICRHVLEHIAQPVEFLRGLRETMPPGSAAYIEVPNGEWVARAGSGWDVIYEHVNYFTPRALKNVCALAGLRPIRLQQRYDGQFLGVEAVAESEHQPDPGDPAAERALWERLGAGHQEKIAAWNRRLEQWSDRGSRAAIWGAGSKGVMFLNSVPGAAENVGTAIDVSPRKEGMYIVGTGTPIARPAGLKGTETRIVILANPIYRDEVGKELAGLGMAGVELVDL